MLSFSFVFIGIIMSIRFFLWFVSKYIESLSSARWKKEIHQLFYNSQTSVWPSFCKDFQQYQNEHNLNETLKDQVWYFRYKYSMFVSRIFFLLSF